MKTMLRIDSSTRLEGSFSRDLGAHFERTWLAQNPGANVVHRDVALEPIEHIRNLTVAGYYTPTDQLTPELREATAQSDALIRELETADTVLITTPMYNFSIPSSLKAWVDQIVRIHKTFSYDGSSFGGLLTGKKAYVVIAYGASGYIAGEGFAAANFVESYLRFILNFLGISDVQFFHAQATTAAPEVAAQHKANAEAEITRAIQAIHVPVSATDRQFQVA
jgi:FMN-dependent NADH-azoreductase